MALAGSFFQERTFENAQKKFNRSKQRKGRPKSESLFSLFPPVQIRVRRRGRTGLRQEHQRRREHLRQARPRRMSMMEVWDLAQKNRLSSPDYSLDHLHSMLSVCAGQQRGQMAIEANHA